MGGVNVKNTIVEGLLGIVAPHPCFGCHKTGTVLCLNCKYNIINEPFSGCMLCGKHTQVGICAEHDVAFCKAWVVHERKSVMKQLIDAYKFTYVKAVSRELVDLLDARLPLLPANTLIVPVPTASSHVRQRGYDHIDILTRLFAERRHLKTGRLLARSSSKTQHQLNKKERQQEARQSFYPSKDVTVDSTTPILILDDIVTTGSTVSSAATVLKQAGFHTIFVAALAYQPLD